jgi:hypothetical protein
MDKQILANVNDLITNYYQQHLLTKELIRIAIKYLKDPTYNAANRELLIVALEQYLTAGDDHATH